MQFVNNDLWSLSTLAGLLLFISYMPYNWHVLMRNGESMRSTWIIFAAFDAITLFGMAHEGVEYKLAVGALVGSTLTMLISLRYGKRGWSKLDIVCLGIGAVALALYFVYPTAAPGIVASNIGVFVGMFPTYDSAIKQPELESKAGWTIGFLACVVAVVGLKQWSFSSGTQPVNFLAIETVIMWILFVRRPRRWFTGC